MIKSSSKVVAGAIAMALTAMVANSQAALAAASNPEVVASAPPSYLLSARGLSTDSFYSDGEGECTACDTDVDDRGCFFADGDSGGNGYFQLSNASTTPMTWVIELDYNSLEGQPNPDIDQRRRLYSRLRVWRGGAIERPRRQWLRIRNYRPDLRYPLRQCQLHGELCAGDREQLVQQCRRLRSLEHRIIV